MKRIIVIGFIFTILCFFTYCYLTTPPFQETIEQPSITPTKNLLMNHYPVLEHFEAPVYSHTFSDHVGRKISLEQFPNTVTILDPSLAEIWSLAGGNISITTKNCLEHKIALNKEYSLLTINDTYEINSTKLLSLSPDFVLLSMNYVSQIELADTLQTHGIKTALFHMDDVYDYLSILKVCTDLLNTSDAYNMYGSKVLSDIKTTIAYAKQEIKKPKVLLLYITNNSVSVKTTNHFAGKILKELGADNIATHDNTLLEALCLTTLKSENPDFILLITPEKHREESIQFFKDAYASNPSFQSLNAVKNGNCIFLPESLFSKRPNANWANAYQYLYELIYHKPLSSFE